MENNRKNKKDFVTMTPKELLLLRQKAQKEHFELKMKNAVKWLKQTHHIRIAKKNIARINTFFKIACLKNQKPPKETVSK
jgi:ribosomal protein L29